MPPRRPSQRQPSAVKKSSGTPMQKSAGTALEASCSRIFSAGKAKSRAILLRFALRPRKRRRFPRYAPTSAPARRGAPLRRSVSLFSADFTSPSPPAGRARLSGRAYPAAPQISLLRYHPQARLTSPAEILPPLREFRFSDITRRHGAPRRSVSLFSANFASPPPPAGRARLSDRDSPPRSADFTPPPSPADTAHLPGGDSPATP